MNTVATCDPGEMRKREESPDAHLTLFFLFCRRHLTPQRGFPLRGPLTRTNMRGVKMKTGTPDLGAEQTSATSVGIISGKHSGDASSSAFPLPSFCSPSSSSSSSSYSPEPVRKKKTSFKRGRLKQMSQQECRGEKEPELHLPSNNSR